MKDEEAKNESQPKRRRILPPPSFSSKPNAKPPPVDDPALHQGRKRTKEHVEGDWPTHIYLSIDLPKEIKSILSNIIDDTSKESSLKWHSLMTTQNDQLHLSLSRPLALKAPQLKTFRIALTHAVHQINPISFHFARFCHLTNDDQSRSFLALEVGNGHSSLKNLVEKINEILNEFGLEEYYHDPIFHSSILWSLINPEKVILEEIETKEIEKNLNQNQELNKIRSLEVLIDKVELTIGQHSWSLPLKDS
ncbi:U6 snRNA phosphodiesterase Usb1 [Melampsora americana]|nr:U6 snRNA phosphodiesterase Usb1 [Melampsora americana]